MKVKFSLCVALGILGMVAARLQARPVISHETVKTAVPGKAISIIVDATDKESDIKSVALYFTPSKNSSPNKVKMAATGLGTYYGSIPEQFTRNTSRLYYYFEAVSKNEEWVESKWHTINLTKALAHSGATALRLPSPPTQKNEDEGEDEKSWFWPAVIGGGILVAGGVALASSGGSSSDGGSTTTNESPQTETTIRVADSDNQTSSSLTFPLDRTISAVDLAGRTVTGGQVAFNYNPADGFAEEFSILYNNGTIFTSGQVTTAGQATISFVGSSDTVIIRVLSSEANGQGTHNFTWNAIVSFFVQSTQ